MKIPLMDLQRQYQAIKQEIDPAIQNILTKASFIGGPEKENFEKEFASACGTKFCLGVGNGTDSLMIALKAAGIGPGDEVLVPANSFIATSEMVSAVGATPVFVDVREDDFLIDLTLVEKILASRSWKKGGKVKAIIPVHLYGRLCDMERIMSLAKQHDLFVLEDCAQAHLAEKGQRRAGGFGHAGSFSFYPGKNLGAYGDGGALTTNDPALYERMKKLANHGRIGKYDHEMEGFNSRLDALQAAVLRVKLRHLPEWTQQRRQKAETYRKLFADKRLSNIVLPQHGSSEKEHVYHLFVVRVPHRDQIQSRMKEAEIECIIHYPTALPFLKAYERYNHMPQDFPVAFRLQNEILSLPLFPEMTMDEQVYVVETLSSLLKEL